MLPDAYGCIVANRFGDLLDDEADPFDLINHAEKENEKKKKKKKDEEEKKGKQKKPGQKESQKDRRLRAVLDSQEPLPVHKQQQARPPPVTEKGDGRDEAQRGMKRASAGQRREKPEEVPQEFSVPKPSYGADSEPRGRGGIRGRRGARGGGYTRNQDTFNIRGKREYDRHNGTGISPEEKRGGRGPWNWGCVDEAASELMEVTPNPPVKSEETQMAVEEETPNHTTDEDGDVVVQVAMEMSLDEWKALQEMSRSKPEFKIRKAEDKIPTKAKVIHQSKYLEKVKDTTDNDGNFLRRSVNDITSLLDINFGSLGRPSRGGRGRGRGGQSGRPERAHPIMEREDDLPPNPDDPEDFPALSVES